jgi:large subunit ribosomal protein L22
MVKLQREQWIRHNIYMEYQATSKYIRTSTRKLRLVADAIRKLAPEQALTTLLKMPKRAAGPMAKVLASTLANAKAKSVDTGKLTFKTIEVMGGPGMKRWMAVSRGQGHAYKKRMTHVRIIVTDDVPVLPVKAVGGKNGTKS